MTAFERSRTGGLRRPLVGVLLCAALLGCTAPGEPAADERPRPLPWDGTVQAHGALRAMLHQGRTGKVVSLDAYLPDPELYAVGALADLA